MPRNHRSRALPALTILNTRDGNGGGRGNTCRAGEAIAWGAEAAPFETFLHIGGTAKPLIALTIADARAALGHRGGKQSFAIRPDTRGHIRTRGVKAAHVCGIHEIAWNGAN